MLYEAKSFGLEPIYLDNSPLKFGQPVSYRLLIEDETFWSKVFKTSISFNLGKLSQALPVNYLRKVYAKWGYHTEGDLLFSEINKFQKSKLNHEVHLLKNLNDENNSFFSNKISDLKNSLHQTNSQVNEIKACLIEAEAQATRAEAKASQIETQASRAEAQAARAEAQASQTETRAVQAEAKAVQAEVKAAKAEAQASRIEKSSTGRSSGEQSQRIN